MLYKTLTQIPIMLGTFYTLNILSEMLSFQRDLLRCFICEMGGKSRGD